MKLVWCITAYEGVPLTYRKVYKVVEELTTHYIILDDDGDRRFLRKDRFIPLGELSSDLLEGRLDEAYNKGYQEGVKQALCDVRNSIKNIEKHNGL